MKALSTSKADNPTGEARSPEEAQTSQHGSGSVAGASDERVQGSPAQNLIVDSAIRTQLDVLAEGLSTEALDELVVQLQARRQAAATRAIDRGLDPADRKFDTLQDLSKPVSRVLGDEFTYNLGDEQWQSVTGFGSGRVPSTDERTMRMPTWQGGAGESTSKKSPSVWYEGPGAVKKKDERVKLDTLIKTMKEKGLVLTGAGNYEEWIKGLREVGKYRQWDKDFFSIKSEAELKRIFVDENNTERQEAYLTVESTISKDIKYIMGSVAFAHVEEAVAKYADKYGAVTDLQKGMLQKDLWSMSQESTGLDIGAFISRIESESRKCREAGHVITDNTMCAVLLNGMLPDFSPIKGSLSIGPDYLKNFSLTSSVVSNYAKDNGLSLKKAKAKMKSENGIAYIANAKICYDWRNSGKCSRGDNCKFKESHVEREDGTAKTDTICYNCNKKGHYARECRSKSKDQPKKQQSKAMTVQASATSDSDEGDEEEEEEKPKAKAKTKVKAAKGNEKGNRFLLPMLLSVDDAKHDVGSAGLDTCASSHLWNDINDFIPGSLHPVNMNFVVGDSDNMPVKQAGDVLVSQGKNGEVIRFVEVGYAPKIPMNLISFGKLSSAGVSAKHSLDGKSIELSMDGVKLLKAKLKSNVFMIEGLIVHKTDDRCLVNVPVGANSSPEGVAKKSQNFLTPGEAPGSPTPVFASSQLSRAKKVFENELEENDKVEIVMVNIPTNNEDILDEDKPEDELSEILDGTVKPADMHSVPGISELTYMDVHTRFGHVNLNTCFRIMGLPPPDRDSLKIECDACEREKQMKQSIPDKAQTRASLPLYRLHVDSSGKRCETEGGNRYFVVVVDDASRKGWIILTATKDEIPAKLIVLIKQLMAQRPGLKMAFMRFDGAGEYKQQDFETAVTEMGGTFETSAPYRQAQNGVAEARIGLISKMARTMMAFSSSNHPRTDWGYAVMHANTLINMIPTKANGGLSPNEVWGDPRSRLPIPGPLFCAGYAKVYKRGKMDPEAVKVVYMGNADGYKAFLVRPLEGPSNAVHATRDATFFPTQMPYNHPLVRQIMNAPQEPDEEDYVEAPVAESIPKLPSDEVTDVPQEVSQEAVKPDVKAQGEIVKSNAVKGYTPGSKVYVVDRNKGSGKWQIYKAIVDSNREDGLWLKFKTEKNVYGGYKPEVDVFKTKTMAEKLLKSTEKAYPTLSKESVFATMKVEDNESLARHLEEDPKTRAEMMKLPQRAGFIDAEAMELAQLMEQKVFELVELTSGMNVLDNKWVYKTKRHPTSGEVKKYRSRLVAKGFKERFGIEYFETFSSNVKMEVVRLLLAMATYYDLDIIHFDIKAYFLYGHMNENVYMHQPEGYHEGPARGEPGEKVCKLLKALYGTKQAQRCADKVLIKALADGGVYPTASDSSLYYARDGNKIFLCGMYVDDGLCVTNNKEFAEEKIAAVKKVFDIEVIDDPKVFVGIQIERNRKNGTMLLHQEDAVLKLLATSGMYDCKPAKTPMQVGLSLKDPSTIKASKEERQYPFQSIVGQLMWLLGTRFDICYAINVMTRYMSNWDEESIMLLKRIIRYLKGKEKLGLKYSKAASNEKIEQADQAPTRMVFYGDADYAGRVHDSKSTGGSASMFGENMVSFHTKTHPADEGISTSTSQAEGVTCKLICNAIVWTSELLKEIQVRGYGPIILHQDNQSVISLSINPVNHKRSKHYRIAMHYVRDLVMRNVVKLQYLNTEVMIADILTKALAEGRFEELLSLANFGSAIAA